MKVELSYQCILFFTFLLHFPISSFIPSLYCACAVPKPMFFRPVLRDTIGKIIEPESEQQSPHPTPPYVPYVVNEKEGTRTWLDIYNALGRNRKLFLSRPIDSQVCNILTASLLWLDFQNKERPITIYLNADGGDLQSALSIYDVMQEIQSPIEVINIGLTTGIAASLIPCGGTIGKRYAFPNSQFYLGKAGLYSSPSAMNNKGMEGFKGPLSTVINEVQHIKEGNQRVLEILAEKTHQSLNKIEKDFQRNFYLTASEAVLYGLIDAVLKPNRVCPSFYFSVIGNDAFFFFRH